MKPDYSARLARLRQLMNEAGCEALCLFSAASLRYFSAYSGEAAYGLITPMQAHLITDYRFIEQAEEECSGWHCHSRQRDRESLGQVIARLLKQEAISTGAFEAGDVSVALWQQIAADTTAVADVRWQAAPDWSGQLRRRKDAFEIACIRQAASIADRALASIMPLMTIGVSEAELALELDYRLRQYGAEALSFDTILGFGARSALPHCIPSARRLQAGDLIVLDFGAVINGYRSDMTRSFVCGQPDARQQLMYRAVEEAQQSAMDVLRSGIRASFADSVAKEVLSRYGFGDYAGSSLGHGVGLRLHEQPIMGPDCHETLEAGYVITIEPGVYVPGYGGVRIEDDVLITEQGFEPLTHAPKNFVLDC